MSWLSSAQCCTDLCLDKKIFISCRPFLHFRTPFLHRYVTSLSSSQITDDGIVTAPPLAGRATRHNCHCYCESRTLEAHQLDHLDLASPVRSSIGLRLQIIYPRITTSSMPVHSNFRADHGGDPGQVRGGQDHPQGCGGRSPPPTAVRGRGGRRLNTHGLLQPPSRLSSRARDSRMISLFDDDTAKYRSLRCACW